MTCSNGDRVVPAAAPSVVGMPGFEPGRGARRTGRLGQLADLVKRQGVTTVFTEELVSPRIAARATSP